MSNALRNMSVSKQNETIARRLAEKSGGLGYLAAVDSQDAARVARIKADIAKALTVPVTPVTAE